jgi:hypothetical protein
MRKRLITPSPQDAPPLDEGWLDLDGAAMVEVTSEEKEYPVESALVSGETRGWRAASPGTQTIRLIFDQPQRLRRISLAFEENEINRTQEFVLRWSPDGGRSFREIVRQQWNFRPLLGSSAPLRCNLIRILANLFSGSLLGDYGRSVGSLKHWRQVHLYSGTPGRTVWAQSRQTNRPSL